MTRTELKQLHAIVKDKTAGRTAVMEFIGTTAIKDITKFIEDNDRLPFPKEIVTQYLTLPNFENILGVAEVTTQQVEKFIGVLLNEAEEDDFSRARVM
jgi:hypothetical protein